MFSNNASTSTDSLSETNWYESKGYRIEEFHTADGRLLLEEAEVNKMVQAMAAFSPQAGSESHLTAMPREQLESVTGNKEINVSAMMIAYIVRDNVESRG